MVLGDMAGSDGRGDSHSPASCGREEVGSESDSHYTPAPLHSRQTQGRKTDSKEYFLVAKLLIASPSSAIARFDRIKCKRLSHIVSVAQRGWITESESVCGGRRW